MDREDRRRYFIVGSVILEVVTPLFWKRIENDYTSCGLASLQDFLNKQSTIHVLFHLRHRNTWCCKDKTKCSNNRSLPLQYCQWDLLYTETNPGVNPHDCHCKFSANPVQLDDLDITLASLILLNCCTLTPDEKAAIKELRQYKNDYLSHNIKGAITKREYRTLWADLTNFILQLDPSIQDNLTRIEARPLDEALCSRYCISLLDLHERLDEINSTIQTMNNSVQGSLQNMDTTVQSSLQNMGSSMQVIGNSVQGSLQNMGTSMQGTLRNIDTSLQELLFYARRGMACQCYAERSDNQEKRLPFRRKYKLGQSIFKLHHQTDLTSVVSNDLRYDIRGIVMMDDGRLVMCLPHKNKLLICNTDGSPIDRIHVQGLPCYVAAVNNSTVAVTLLFSECIEMYDINNKLKLKSISVPGMRYLICITTINNKLVVGGNDILQIIDHQTGEVVQTIPTDCPPDKIHGSGDRIFYCHHFFGNNKKLYWYSYSDDRHHSLTLPSRPRRMTTLQDGSLYVMCNDGSLQHVSSDGKQYKPVTGLEQSYSITEISNNKKQRKLTTIYGSFVQLYNEI
ncbi:uncharacterized protein LOC127726381 [Mytilus californianus]|uniref:uncharacterized protein LOC127726381 n=1 Tax=Mytilus californianus TaxID=6549 RepID=UPI0022474003|nr:uncharacterized protein LOC127726381 [Mytilus californianus]XP_052089727.1 uncharacterized protein LOC127726381 [Mytilus californianus]